MRWLVLLLIAHKARGQPWKRRARSAEPPQIEATPTVADVGEEIGLLLSSFAEPTDALASRAPRPKLDAAVFAAFTLVLLAVNWGLRLYLVQPLAVKALAGPFKPARAYKSAVVKFSQAAMEYAFYGAFSVLGLLIVPAQEWIWPSKHWWIGFSSGSHAAMRDDLRCYYLLYGARYVQAGVSVILEPKRKDFVEMMLHHAVTVAVVAISYLYGWNRIGCVVMLLFDPADVPLHAAKMCKYVADARAARQPALAGRFTFCADRTFEVFAVAFLVTRIAMFPYVCWSAHVEATRYFPKGPPEWTCVGLLWTLYALNCYWFFLIIKVAVRMMVTGNAEDVRSDDEEEDPKES
mmetsp:Transcript_3766/g.11151  ORF Transcript_3766/g.11151 Transcript_3766/m.11151 type:complete len:349 (+) Transcript_3766:176-1222(+)